MGVHYHAFPVRREHLEIARTDPRHYLSCVSPDDDDDEWDKPENERLHLFLEKNYRSLDAFFRTVEPNDDADDALPWSLHDRIPAESDGSGRDLVGRGAREHRRLGRWVTFRVLSPTEVSRIAAGIADYEPADVIRAGFDEQEIDRITHYLPEAQRFAARCAAEDLGVMYIIG